MYDYIVNYPLCAYSHVCVRLRANLGWHLHGVGSTKTRKGVATKVKDKDDTTWETNNQVSTFQLEFWFQHFSIFTQIWCNLTKKIGKASRFFDIKASSTKCMVYRKYRWQALIAEVNYVSGVRLQVLISGFYRQCKLWITLFKITLSN